jgi:hypothetical protein
VQKTSNITPLRPDNQLLGRCRATLASKMRLLGIRLISSERPEPLPYRPIVTIKPDPVTRQKLEAIREQRRETLDRIKRNPAVNPIASNMHAVKMPRHKKQYSAPLNHPEPAA